MDSVTRRGAISMVGAGAAITALTTAMPGNAAALPPTPAAPHRTHTVKPLPFNPARLDGLSTLRSIGLMFWLGRGSLLTAFLAAFGRAIAEVGAILIVGGNIAGFTRTMTTAIALETSKGDLPLALGLGLILLTLSVAVSTIAFLLVGRLSEK